MQSYDCLIVGGGPAGSACAWALHRAGLGVAVLDKARFPRDKVCAGWITPQVVEALELDLSEYAGAFVLQPMTAFRVGRIGGRNHRLAYDRPVSYGIRRCEFDTYLLERSGAYLFLGDPVRELRRAGATWIVDDQFEAPMLVAAGGHFCPVARWLNGSSGNAAPAVLAQELEFPMSPEQAEQCSVHPEVPEIYFCNDFLGYGWCVRKRNFLNVGLGREDPGGLAQHVERFLEFLQAEGKFPADAPRRFHGHAYVVHERSTRRLADEGVLAIGDAAGLAYGRSGEGIRPAIESGLFAADVILAAKGRYTSDRLAPYARLVRERFGPRHQSGIVPAPTGPWRRRLTAWLMERPWFLRQIVVNRFFLHAQQPALRR